MDIVWSFLCGAAVGAFFSRLGWGYDYIGKFVDKIVARLAK